MKSHRTIACMTALCVLLGITLPGTAASGAPVSDNQTRREIENRYQVNFFSLKPGNSIGSSRLVLTDEKALTLSIENETLEQFSGNYQIEGGMFKADVGFTLKRDPRYRYTMIFKGLWLFDTAAAGTARLTERSLDGRELQSIPFLFYIARPGTSPAKSQKPFWAP